MTTPDSPTTCERCGLPLPKGSTTKLCPPCGKSSGLPLASPRPPARPMLDEAFDPKKRQFGDYVLGRQLGAGGMGVVYAARQISQPRSLAIKLIRDSRLASSADMCRFTIETEAAARLDHPNIVRIHEVGECEGHHYFCMDLVDGQSLTEHIAHGELTLEGCRNRKDPECQWRHQMIARLMAKTARAVEHAHVRGVVHRDLKPGNILLDADGEPRLTDFGLAKILQSPADGRTPVLLTAPGDLLGTPNYMAPEQITRGEATRASDIYGLGAVLYELLTGHPPFETATALETLRRIVEQNPTRPSTFAPVDPDLETICLKCMEKNPADRYISAGALAEDLDRWLEGKPIEARPPSIAHQAFQWIRRNPIGTALILSLFLGFSVSLGLLKKVEAQRREIELDWNQSFDEGMNKISQIWKDSSSREVTISARELSILAGEQTPYLSQPGLNLHFGVSASGDPSSMAQRYARLLVTLQGDVSRALGKPVVFSLKLFKQSNQDEETLVHGDADLMVLSAVDYVTAKSQMPGVQPVAREKIVREAVLFAVDEKTNIAPFKITSAVAKNTNLAQFKIASTVTGASAGVTNFARLKGKALTLPDPDLSLHTQAKARMAAAGLHASDFAKLTVISDQGSETGQNVVSFHESIQMVLKHAADAGVTYRDRFERFSYLGLVRLDQFNEYPTVLAARPGLDPDLIKALKQVIAYSRFKAQQAGGLSEVPTVLVPVEDTYFDDLRTAIRQAREFDTQ